MTKTIERCAWAAKSDAVMQQYHDKEWGVPEHDSRALWELLMLEGFQAGLSWQIILRKREGFRHAFKGFDPRKVARFTQVDVERLMQDENIVRARAKIEATISGAKLYLDMRQRGEDFAAWIWSLAGGKPIQDSWNQHQPIPAQTALSEHIAKELKKRGFKFCGPTIVYAFMQAVGIVNDHSDACHRRRPVARLK